MSEEKELNSPEVTKGEIEYFIEFKKEVLKYSQVSDFLKGTMNQIIDNVNLSILPR